MAPSRHGSSKRAWIDFFPCRVFVVCYKRAMVQRVIGVALGIAVIGPIWIGFEAFSDSERSAQPAKLPASATHSAPTSAWPRYTLRAEQTWQLNLPNGEPFD